MRLLDNYSSLAAVKENLESSKLSAHLDPPHKLFTLSSGIDVELSGDVRVFTARQKGDNQVEITEVTGNDLLLDNGRKGVKANNGVLIAFANGQDGQQTDVVASPTKNNLSKIGSTPATGNAKSYAGNELIPAIEETHFTENICILSDNQFHPVAAGDHSEVPACKAVMPGDGASTRSLIIVEANGTTALRDMRSEEVKGEKWFDLQGRSIDKPVKKGIYVKNGQKVIIK